MLNALGIAMDFPRKEITWDKAVVLMRSFTQINEDDLPVAQQLLNEFLDEDYDDDNTEAIAAEVLDDEFSLKRGSAHSGRRTRRKQRIEKPGS